MTTWSDRVYYCIHRDAEVSRVSGFDDHCQEHFIVVETGKGYRDRRDAAVEKIMASIERGDPAGEVDPKPPAPVDEDWREQ